MASPRPFLIAAIFLLVAGLLLGFAAKGAGPLPGDLAVTHGLQSVLPYSDHVSRLWQLLGNALPLWPFIAVLVTLVVRQWNLAALFAASAFPVMVYGETLLKPLYGRPRPSADLVTIYKASSGLSYPSGTAMSSLAVFGVVFYLVWRLSRTAPLRISNWVGVGLVALFFLLTNLARIHVGAHWLSDILGGWCFSGAWLAVCVAVHEFWLQRKQATPVPAP